MSSDRTEIVAGPDDPPDFGDGQTALLSALLAPLLILDANGNFIYANPRAERLLRDGLRSRLEEHLKGRPNQASRGQVRFSLASGGETIVRFSLSHIKWNGKPATQVFIRNVTPYIELIDDLKARIEKFESSGQQLAEQHEGELTAIRKAYEDEKRSLLDEQLKLSLRNDELNAELQKERAIRGNIEASDKLSHDKVVSLSAEAEALRKNIDEQAGRLRDAQSEASDLRSQIDALSGTRREIEIEVEALRHKINDQNSAMESLELSMAEESTVRLELEKEVSARKSEATTLNESLKGLQERFAVATSEKEKALEDIKVLQRDLVEARLAVEDTERLRKHLDEARASQEHAQSARSQAETSLEALKKKFESLQLEHQEAIRDRDEVLSREQSLSTDIAAAREELAALKADRGALADEASRLRTELELSKCQADEARRLSYDLDAACKNMELREQELIRLREEMERLQKVSMEQQSAAEAAIAAKKEDAARIQTEIAEAVRTAENLRVQRDRLQEKLKDQIDKSAGLDSRLKKTAAEMDSMEKEVKAARKKLTKVRWQAHEYKLQRDELESRLKFKSRELEQLQLDQEPTPSNGLPAVQDSTIQAMPGDPDTHPA